MDNFRKAVFIFCIFLLGVYIPSALKLIHTQTTINHMNSVKDSLRTVNLSNINVVQGDKVLGVDLQSGVVFINGKRVTNVKEVIETLGNDYATNFYGGNSSSENYLYVDKANNLQLYVTEDYRTYLFMGDLDRHYSDWYTTVDFWPPGGFGPKLKALAIQIAFYPLLLSSSNKFIDPTSLVIMPIVYFILFIPTMIAIVVSRYRIIGLLIQLLIFFAISIEFFSFASKL